MRLHISKKVNFKIQLTGSPSLVNSSEAKVVQRQKRKLWEVLMNPSLPEDICQVLELLPLFFKQVFLPPSRLVVVRMVRFSKVAGDLISIHPDCKNGLFDNQTANKWVLRF